jgi:carbamoyltransferase
VAAAIQERVEEIVVGWIEARRKGRTALALAGGLFANVALNGRLAQLFDDIYVFPHMGDGGLCVGAAVAERCVRPLGLPFLGPLYSDHEMQAALQQSGLAVQRFEHPEEVLAQAICEGLIAARFVGRSEFGPRALGHRSILLRADQPALAERLNQQLVRDEFMPFAPIRRHGAGSPTMTVVVPADDELKSKCPAAVHLDGTARTQIVSQTASPGLWRLLECAESEGFPALINTSFNLHSEPIVETPEHAVATFLAAELDIMQMGPYIVRRES